MYRGTTPKITLETDNEDIDLTEFSNIHIIVTNGSYEKIFEKEDISVEDKKLIILLSQEDTLAFSVGKVQVQIRCITESGLAYASNIMTTDMEKILEEGVIEP